MDFSFGVITDGKQDANLQLVVESVRNLNIPKYEIIIVGKTLISGNDIYNIDFDENEKNAWITKKKNLITKFSNYENIVYSHDYVTFHENWYEGFLNFNSHTNYSVCMNRIINLNGDRFRDWLINPFEVSEELRLILSLRPEGLSKPGYACILPYWVTNLTELMYISGTYWVAKKDVMMEFPLNESLLWGQGEDVEWSNRIRNKYKFSINANSAVLLIKQKEEYFIEADQYITDKLIKYHNNKYIKKK
jgi:hypothetical protein